MAVKTIAAYDGTTDSGNIQQLVRGTVTADTLANGMAVATTDTFVIDVEGNDDILIVIEEQNAGIAVVTFDAGANPPSPRAGLGADTATVPQADSILFVPEAGRHVQADGTITGSVATADVHMWVFRLPAGFLGTGRVNVTSIPAAPTD